MGNSESAGNIAIYLSCHPCLKNKSVTVHGDITSLGKGMCDKAEILQYDSFLKGVDYVDVQNPAPLVHRMLLKKTGFRAFVKTHFFLFIMYSHVIQNCYFSQTWITVFGLHLDLLH